jgi:hypothetical protein
MKVVTLIFYGVDGSAAKDAAARIRAESNCPALVRDAAAFCGDVEPCGRVIVMPDVAGHDAGRIKAAYGNYIATPGAPPPPPPPPFDPLVNLAPDWRKRDDLRQLAASVSGGRSVENKAQAIAVIEAALKARG